MLRMRECRAASAHAPLYAGPGRHPFHRGRVTIYLITTPTHTRATMTQAGREALPEFGGG